MDVRRSIRGTTLIELMVSVAILGVCGAALLRLVGAAGAMADVSTQKVALLHAIRSNLQELKSSAVVNGTLSNGTVTITPTIGRGITTSITRTVSKIGGGQHRIWSVSYTATWNGGTGGRRSGTMTLETKVVALNE